MRRATCWAPGCEADLAVVDGWYQCPKGCALRDAGRWVLDHVAYMSRAPVQVARIFEARGDT